MNLTPYPATRSRPPVDAPPSTPRRSARRRAFTLNEVLVALGVLAIGSVAVASLFPTAAFLQKEAINETLRQNNIRSADAILEGVGIDNIAVLEFIELVNYEVLQNGTASTYPAAIVRVDIEEPAYDVFALSEVDLHVWSSYDDPAAVAAAGATIPSEDNTTGAGNADKPDMRMSGGSVDFDPDDFDDSYIYDTNNPSFPSGRFPVSFRSLPTLQPAVAGTYRDRALFWVPLIRAGYEASSVIPDWSVYAFILEPPSQARAEGAYLLRNLGLATFPGQYPAFNRDDIICANPEGTGVTYFPKVFRVPQTTAPAFQWDELRPNIFTPDVNLFGYVKVGDKVLGDNGKIYRVVQINPATGQMLLNSDQLYEPINERPLAAIWVAPAPGTTATIAAGNDSPLADIRLLSNTVIRTTDY